MSRLRMLVERWLASSQATQVRISRFGYAGSGRRRHVRVEWLRAEGSIVILFFRHDDGTWHVFPPERGAGRWSMGNGKGAE